MSPAPWSPATGRGSLAALLALGLLACAGPQPQAPPVPQAVSVPPAGTEAAAPPASAEPVAGSPRAPAPEKLDPCAAPAPGLDDQRQHTVPLREPRETRTVVLAADGATITFGFRAFEAAARCSGESSVLAYLAAHPERTLTLAARALPDNRYAFVIAALLDRGLAAVVDDATRAPVESLVREGWNWIGCGGGCRQSGRAYRLRVPGAEIFRTTDLFEDSF